MGPAVTKTDMRFLFDTENDVLLLMNDLSNNLFYRIFTNTSLTVKNTINRWVNLWNPIVLRNKLEFFFFWLAKSMYDLPYSSSG